MRIPTLLAALALGVLGGCATTGQSFTGTVTPSDAALFSYDAATVQVSLVDAATGSVVATESYAVEGRREAIPFRFSTTQPLAADARYALRARVISRTGAVLYQSPEAMPITVPASGSFAVQVEPMAAGG